MELKKLKTHAQWRTNRKQDGFPDLEITAGEGCNYRRLVPDLTVRGKSLSMHRDCPSVIVPTLEVSDCNEVSDYSEVSD